MLADTRALHSFGGFIPPPSPSEILARARDVLTLSAMQARWAILVCLVGCGSGGNAAIGGKEKLFCERGIQLCSVDEPAALQECRDGMPEVKKHAGADYGKLLDCSIAAKSCGEYAGCLVGGIGNGLLDEAEDFGHAMKRMMKDKVGDKVDRVRRSFDDDDALPSACKRIETVCSASEPFIRRECTKLVENLGVDKARIAELTSCIDASANCFALQKCVDEMEGKMRGF